MIKLRYKKLLDELVPLLPDALWGLDLYNSEVESTVNAVADEYGFVCGDVNAMATLWFYDNKPHGFDVQDYRIGALLYRTDACRRRILDYVNGKSVRIEELVEALLPYGEAGQSMSLNKVSLFATANIVHHCSETI